MHLYAEFYQSKIYHFANQAIIMLLMLDPIFFYKQVTDIFVTTFYELGRIYLVELNVWSFILCNFLLLLEWVKVLL